MKPNFALLVMDHVWLVAVTMLFNSRHDGYLPFKHTSGVVTQRLCLIFTRHVELLNM